MNYDYMILQNHTIPVNENDGLPLSKCYWAILATALGVGISVIDNRQCGFTDHRLRPGNFAVRNDLDSKCLSNSDYHFSPLFLFIGRHLRLPEDLLIRRFAIQHHLRDLYLCRLVLDADSRPYFTRIRSGRNH